MIGSCLDIYRNQWISMVKFWYTVYAHKPERYPVPMYWQHCSSFVSPSMFSSTCSRVPCASSTLQVSQLGNRFSIFNINQNTFLIPYISLFLILACSDWNNHTVTIIYLLNQNELRSELALSCQAECYPLSQLRSRLDIVKVIPTVWGYLLCCSNQQNLFSITVAVEEKMDSMHIDRYWFGNFWGTNKMASQLFNCFYLPPGIIFWQFLDKWQHLKTVSWSNTAKKAYTVCFIITAVLLLFFFIEAMLCIILGLYFYSRALLK